MLNLPNTISVIRICLVPVFLFLFWSTSPYHIQLGMAVLALAGLTDILDGFLARKLNMITMLGKVLDPMADKLMTIAALTSLYLTGNLPLWLVVLVIVKDIVLITGSFFIVFREKVQVSASIYGKAATISIYVALFAGAFSMAGSTLLAVIAAVISLLALINYINGFIRHRVY